MLGHGLTSNVAPGLYFLSDIFGNVVRPMLQRVEGDDANWIIELPGHKIADDGFEVRALDLGLAVHVAILKTVDHEIDRLICAKRNGTWRPARSGRSKYSNAAGTEKGSSLQRWVRSGHCSA